MFSMPARLLARGPAAHLTASPRPLSAFCAAARPALFSSMLRTECQQRYASSKPDGARGIDNSSHTVNTSPAQGRRRGRKSNAANAATKGKQEAHYKLPSVPSTQHVHPNDIHVASFFSVHRPISVTSSVPQSTQSDLFDAIFSDKKNGASPNEVMNTLGSAVQQFESALPDEHADADTLQFDGSSMQDSQAEVQKFYRPFCPPPPPVPQDAKNTNTAGATKAAEAHEAVHRTYSTLLTIRESKHLDGHTTYEAHTTPFVQVNEKDAPSSTPDQEMVQEPESSNSSQVPTRFLERMRARQMRFDAYRKSRSDMHAISVRRQRKHKMKKHKHKKLLRRTRNLRRKMDKA